MKKARNIVVSDPVADMLTRVRNALRARFESVDIPASKTKAEIARILLDEGYIASVDKTEDTAGRPVLRLVFKMHDGKQRVLQGLRRISKPGLRIYSKCDDLPRVLNGLGIAIVSTSKGIMTDKQAREQKLGGEVLAYIW